MFENFTDRDLGKRFPDHLRRSGLTVHPHHELFVPTTPDEEWIRAVARHGWVCLTHDRRIRYKPNERAAVMDAGVALLVLVGNVPTIDLARNFVQSIDRIEAFLSDHPPPLIAGVYRPTPAELARNPHAPGRIEQRWP